MAIWLDKNLDSLLLDTTNVSVISENFTYLLKQLADFVDPAFQYTDVNKPFLRGGKRRMVRGDRGEGLGYQYKTAATKSKVTNRGTKTITAFGKNVLVEEWTVSHPDVTDPDLGETYPASDKGGPRGPYTCLITARISLSKRTPTRCYVQCNCQDFKTTFYEKLNAGGYTNPQSLPKSTGKKELAPAMCKHLYAIYSKYYRDLVNEVEGFVIDSNPELFGTAQGNATAQAQPSPVGLNVVAKTKQDAIAIIKRVLSSEYARIHNIELAYKDSRSKQAGGSNYHLYPFYVVLLNKKTRGIAYRNRDLAIGPSQGFIKLLNIPNNPNIWNFFSSINDHKLLWDMIKTVGKMPAQLQDKIKNQTGVDVYLENSDIPLYITNTTSNIISSILDLG